MCVGLQESDGYRSSGNCLKSKPTLVGLQHAICRLTSRHAELPVGLHMVNQGQLSAYTAVGPSILTMAGSPHGMHPNLFCEALAPFRPR
jgi:hypothetical protein